MFFSLTALMLNKSYSFQNSSMSHVCGTIFVGSNFDHHASSFDHHASSFDHHASSFDHHASSFDHHASSFDHHAVFGLINVPLQLQNF